MLVTVDFETEAIDGNEPPKPVGVALWEEGQEPEYLAWGHPEGNNTTKSVVERRLKSLWRHHELLFHNAKFDLAVAEKWMDCPLPSWERIHDTMFLLFLHEPHASSLSLKPSAERILGLPPEEWDAVEDWLVDHGFARKGSKGWGAFISKAPVSVVGPYAVGDVVRTYKLYERLLPLIPRGAYDRERRLLPILMRNEREGIRVDARGLRAGWKQATGDREKADQWLRKRLKAPDLNVDADREVAAALDKHGLISAWTLTPTGQRSVSKKNLTPDKFTDPQVASVLGYRARLATCISTFYAPWIDMGARIHTSWNQVRQSHGFDSFNGARTGRLSSNPNFQNIPTDFEHKDDGYVYPKFLKVAPLPLMRNYLLPDARQQWGCRDYNQQELRILAHFEEGGLRDAYLADPRLDIHTFVQQKIAEVLGQTLERKTVKVLNFGMVYGMGAARLAEAVKVSVDDAQRLKAAQRQALPGLKALEQAIRDTARGGGYVETWGGRRYYSEEPSWVGGELRTFEYKLLNYLVQGSAADCTKEALIRYDAARKEGRLLVTVHDEINITAPKKAMKREMEILRECMESVEFDVPMISDGKVGATWGTLA